MSEEEKEYRQKVVLVGGISIGFCLFVAYWYATQGVAADSNYIDILGLPFLSLGDTKIYLPYKFYEWQHNPMIYNACQNQIASYAAYPYIGFLLGAGFTYLATKDLQKQTSHGSASFATKKDIEKAGLGEFEDTGKKKKKKLFGITLYEKSIMQAKKSGVVVGINPYTHKLMLHNGVEHILLMAPTRSGKGVNTIIPTGLVWRNSLFVLDVKGELWQATSGYRQKVMNQKVMKFAPLQGDGSSVRWNPFAEINFQTPDELGDIATIVEIMVRPDGSSQGKDPFWENSAANLLQGVIMHLMYKHYKEKRPLPCPSDVMSFLSSPDKTTDELFTDMKVYPHITPEEFWEKEYNIPLGLSVDEFIHEFDKQDNQPIGEDEDEDEINEVWLETKTLKLYETLIQNRGLYKELSTEEGCKIKFHNPLKEVYGNYIQNFKVFSDVLGETVRSVDEIRQVLLRQNREIEWEAKKQKDKNDKIIIDNTSPFYMLLTHPKVAECAANMLNGAEQTRASIMQTAQTAMALYQNPIVQKNTAVSDFCIQDLLSPKHTVSLYLCMGTDELDTLKPLSRLLINTILKKLVREMKFDSSGGAKIKQRLLLLLDEFPQLGNLQSMEKALAVCAGYGIKVCIVAQDVNQLNKAYTKDNSVGSNCHVHIYFTPNIDSGGSTAESISKQLGKQTIKTVSHSDGGGLGKGSNSESFTARDLMTPDEVSHMSQEKELVFVAGQKPIFGNKLRYYKQPMFTNMLKEYQKIYVREHGWEEEYCKKYNHKCEDCIEKFKIPNGLSAIPCPTFPMYSDIVTKIETYDDLFAVHSLEVADKKEKMNMVMLEKMNDKEILATKRAKDGQDKTKVNSGK